MEGYYKFLFAVFNLHFEICELVGKFFFLTKLVVELKMVTNFKLYLEVSASIVLFNLVLWLIRFLGIQVSAVNFDRI